MLPASGFHSPPPRDPHPDDGPLHPYRRAFLVGAIGFVGGAILGFWSHGKANEAKAAPTEILDPIVAWVREVVLAERVQELREHYHGLLYAIEKMPDDPVVWQGFRQLVDVLAASDLDQQDVLLARALRDSIAVHRPAIADLEPLLEHVRELSNARPR